MMIHSDKILTVSNAATCRAVSSDTGNYSCEPSNAESDTVQVHVLEGTGTKQKVTE